MTLEQQERHLEALEQEAEAVAQFVSSLDTMRLRMIGSAIHDELSMRHEGKPSEPYRLH